MRLCRKFNLAASGNQTPNYLRPSHMTQLFELCKAETKIWRTLPNGAHNDSVAEPGYFDNIHSFISEEVDIEPKDQ